MSDFEVYTEEVRVPRIGVDYDATKLAERTKALEEIEAQLDARYPAWAAEKARIRQYVLHEMYGWPSWSLDRATGEILSPQETARRDKIWRERVEALFDWRGEDARGNHTGDRDASRGSGGANPGGAVVLAVDPGAGRDSGSELRSGSEGDQSEG